MAGAQAGQIEIHCPVCGASVLVPIRVDFVSVTREYLRVSVQDEYVNHKCGEQPK